jgi:ATP-dependent Lon protease
MSSFEGGDGDGSRHVKRPRVEPKVDNIAIANREYSMAEIEHYCRLDADQQAVVAEAEQKLVAAGACTDVPTRFRILALDVADATKAMLLRTLYSISSDARSQQYVDTFLRIPFNQFATPFAGADPRDAIARLAGRLDTAVDGHCATKRHIVRLVAQWMVGPSRKGLVIGLHGPMGVGKTALVERGISRALGLPYNHVNLGGVGDACYLHGHDYTYSGSTPGKIASCLAASGCMNPLFFFDEVDKVSDTPKGAEVAQVLMFLTDATQNHRFQDRYVGHHDLDVSRSVFIFSFNDRTRVDPVLLDRMTIVETSGYDSKQKASIMKRHAIPEILRDFSLPADVTAQLVSDSFVAALVAMCSGDEGMRPARRLFHDTCAELNVQLLSDTARPDARAVLASLAPVVDLDPSLSMMYN